MIALLTAHLLDVTHKIGCVALQASEYDTKRLMGVGDAMMLNMPDSSQKYTTANLVHWKEGMPDTWWGANLLQRGNHFATWKTSRCVCWSSSDNNLGIAALLPKVAAHRQANCLL